MKIKTKKEKKIDNWEIVSSKIYYYFIKDYYYQSSNKRIMSDGQKRYLKVGVMWADAFVDLTVMTITKWACIRRRMINLFSVSL